MNYSTKVSNPTAHITKRKSRIKTYGNRVFLNDGDYFEFELYNPKTSDVLAKIKLNGKYISENGIVVKPGQRVFLERFLDTNNKFKFNTYLIDAGSPTWEAVKNNGDVVVEFYDEYIPLTFNTGSNTFTYYSSNLFNGTLTTNLYNQSLTSGFESNGIGYTNTTNTSIPKQELTGRVEKGEPSQQSFNTSYNSFYSYSFHTVSYKILPRDEKPTEVEDIVNYCPECGKKQKKENKFCPSCGRKL